MINPYGKLNDEVLDLAVKMKIEPDFSNVRQRVRNASLAMKVKYKRAIIANSIDNLLDGNDF
ncbi:hypothetical protein PA10_00132 [Pseudomonas phage pPa_SNUABM_DT01]|nr:hypothetical protein PA10_00132 [Pseudomonas phage pPa_SNUABM_DT01]